MADWIIWLILAGILVILELFTGTFYLLMVALAFATGGMAALGGGSFSLQLIVAALVGVVATYLLRRSKTGKDGAMSASRNPDINLDIGQQVAIKDWDINPGGSPSTARAMYRGAWWDVELAEGNVAQPGLFTIREIRGSRLIVSGKSPHNN